MITLELTTILTTVGTFFGVLLGIFAGYWFKSTNNNIKQHSELIHANIISINHVSDNHQALRDVNEKAEADLKKNLSDLAVEINETTKVVRDIMVSTGNNSFRIQNLESGHKYISDLLIGRDVPYKKQPRKKPE